MESDKDREGGIEKSRERTGIWLGLLGPDHPCIEQEPVVHHLRTHTHTHTHTHTDNSSPPHGILSASW